MFFFQIETFVFEYQWAVERSYRNCLFTNISWVSSVDNICAVVLAWELILMLLDDNVTNCKVVPESEKHHEWKKKIKMHISF